MYRGETMGGQEKALSPEKAEPEEMESECPAEGEELLENLSAWGARPVEAMHRSINDWGFYQKMLFRFAENPLLNEADALYSAGEWKDLYRCIHEIRGSAGMLGLEPLYRTSVELTGLLRRQKHMDEALSEDQIREIGKNIGRFDLERDQLMRILYSCGS